MPLSRSRILNTLTTIALWSALASAPASAQPSPASSRQVAPGVEYAEYLLPGPLSVNVLSLSLREPSVRIETYRPDTLTETSVQAAANDRDGHRVLAAVNADFFSFQTGWPVGNQMVNGTWVLGTRSARSHLAIDTRGRPFIERILFAGSILLRSDSTIPLAGVNLARRSNGVVLYTSYRRVLSDTDSVRTARVLQWVDTVLTAGDTLCAVARRCPTIAGTRIDHATALLAAHTREAAAHLDAEVRDGDTLRLVLGTTPPLHGIRQIIAGCGRFLAGGVNVTDSTSRLEGITDKFTGARHPRTFVGFDRDTTTLYLCTVDGRQTTSIGMTFADMATFLLSLGATEGFNLDGGGSTTMVVQGRIVNSPSDRTGERPVANTLQVIAITADNAHQLPGSP